MPAPYTGACVCRAVRFRLAEEPLTVYACHCSDCQTQAGSAFGLTMFARREAVELTQGEPARFELKLEDGRRKCGWACPRCHGRLWGEPVAAPAIAALHPGNLDDTGWFEPVAHIWTASAQPWVEIPDSPLNDAGQPGDYIPIIQAWQQRSR